VVSHSDHGIASIFVRTQDYSDGINARRGVFAQLLEIYARLTIIDPQTEIQQHVGPNQPDGGYAGPLLEPIKSIFGKRYGYPIRESNVPALDLWNP